MLSSIFGKNDKKLLIIPRDFGNMKETFITNKDRIQKFYIF